MGFIGVRQIGSQKATGSICGFCKHPIETGEEIQLEERSTWFRSDDEVYYVHQSCFDKHKAREAENYRRQQESNEKFRERHEHRMSRIVEELKSKNVSYQVHNDGTHWVLNNKFDWWPSTGTFINRETKKRAYITSHDREKLLKLVL